ncbi:MAG: hypothetical protein A2138_03155 [Deltaproteobacteria bacterium RBG_16_71_12]|nr:MAG: hypothetical protein A2138_03155 [Deltaproteobacteria bacterium RBG_16_71_12]
MEPSATTDSSRPATFEGAMGAPFMAAPKPRAAAKVSSCKGSRMTPTSGSPSTTQATLTANSGMPRRKLVVPSIGSMTHSG